MRNPLHIAFFLLLAVTVAAGLDFFRRHFREEPPASFTVSAPPSRHLRDDWPEEEVFRRAFWRHPGAGDRIVRAVRLEWSGEDGVGRWAWFLQVHPAASLLSDLRDPGSFGLMPVSSPRAWLPGDLPAPDWYPSRMNDAGVEILQHPSQSFTLLYRASDNLLFASDHGHGFAPALLK